MFIEDQGSFKTRLGLFFREARYAALEYRVWMSYPLVPITKTARNTFFINFSLLLIIVQILVFHRKWLNACPLPLKGGDRVGVGVEA